MSNNKASAKNQSWNSQELIKLSQSLGEAYLPGINAKSREKDSWTMSKFVEMNKNVSANNSEDND